ncbi:hypothetical protein [Candidatus Lokiarchaeum ossiferum]
MSNKYYFTKIARCKGLDAMVLLSLNWNIEVIMYFLASLIALLSAFIMYREYKRIESDFNKFLMFSWISLFFYIVGGGFALLILSKTLFIFEIFILIISSFFLVSVFDKLTRSSLDPIKMLVFGIFTAGIVISSFEEDAAISIILKTGAESFQTNGSFHIWLTIFTGLIAMLFFYYCLLIFYRSPSNLKKKASITLIGGFFFSIFAFILYLTRLTKTIPGLMLVTLATGAFLVSFSFYLEPKLINSLIQSETAAKLKNIGNTLPICSHCKQIRDGEDEWLPIESFFLKNSELLFSHGLCPDCYQEFYAADLEDDD